MGICSLYTQSVCSVVYSDVVRKYENKTMSKIEQHNPLLFQSYILGELKRGISVKRLIATNKDKKDTIMDIYEQFDKAQKEFALAPKH